VTRNEQFKLVPKLINKAIEKGLERWRIFSKVIIAMYPANFWSLNCSQIISIV